MKYITIQSDTDLSNPFIEGFVKVGNNIELVADELGLNVSGLLTPYGIKCTMVGETPFFKNFEMSIRRKIENVSTNVIPTKSPYSTILTLESEIPSTDVKTRFKIVKKGVFGKLRSTLSGLKEHQTSDNLVMYSKNSINKKISSSDLEALEKLDWLNFQQGQLKLKSLDVPKDKSKFLSWLNSVEFLIKNSR